MGYTLKIGEYASEFHDEDNTTWISQYAEDAQHDAAPAYGEPTDNTNARWPSYTSWHNFARFVGLEDFFFNEEMGLIRKHPGCVPLARYHQSSIENAMLNFKIKHPNAIPRMTDESEADCQLARLTWLKYWVDWAMQNCERPVFYNS